MYRLRFLGLSAEEAAGRALRELGSPEAVALELGRTHSLPHLARAALFAGVATLLGVQALAGVPTVRAAPEPSFLSCTFDEAFLQRLPAAEAATVRQQLAKPGERARLEAECLKYSPAASRNQLLRLADIIAALRAGGVTVNSLAGFDGMMELVFPGEEGVQSLDLSYDVQRVNGEVYVSKWGLMERLRSSLTAPLRLTGLENLILEIGPARLQLGTAQTPVRATDFYNFPLIGQLSAELTLLKGEKVEIAGTVDNSQSSVPHGRKIAVSDGKLFATLSNEHLLQAGPPAGCDCRQYSLAVRAVTNGLLPMPFPSQKEKVGQMPRAVNTPQELFRATAQKQWAVLVYRLDASDLRRLGLTPVPPSALGEAVTAKP